MTNAVFSKSPLGSFHGWEELDLSTIFDPNFNLGEWRSLVRRISLLRSKSSKLRSKICRDVQGLQAKISSLSCPNRALEPAFTYITRFPSRGLSKRELGLSSKPWFYETPTIENLKAELEALESIVIRLLEQRGDIRGLKNEINGLIVRIVHFTRVGLYQLEPMVRSTFHYLANTCTIEKFVELFKIGNSFSSSTNLQWHTQPSHKLSPLSRQSANKLKPVTQNWPPN